MKRRRWKWKWKLREALREAGITAYRLKVEGGIAHATAYRWVREKNPPTSLDLDTLGAVLSTLRRRTGRPYSLDDILELELEGEET